MKHILPAICILVIFSTCKKDPVAGPAGPQGPPGANAQATPGMFAGKIRQYDQYGTAYTTGLNTTTVSIVGTTFSAVTDATGGYTISNVPVGSYDFLVSRPGSRPARHQQMHMIPNGKMLIGLNSADTAKFTFTGGQLKDTMQFGQKAIKASLSFASDTKQRQALIIFAKTPAIVPNDPATYESGSNLYINSATTELVTYIPYEYSYLDTHFSSGETIYAKVYPNSWWQGNSYDYLNGKEIYNSTGLPLAQTFTLTMP